ncbi:MAG: nucleoside 2-deoxyribosyltransferase [Candidatus Pacebacteria bacterium]|nr:nucleoside 2-deoxyribosyltransferase [Candidatus Paceibacterota bacterium]
MKKVYFASPWFNATQAEREDRVKNKLRELGFDVWSPKDNNSLSPITDLVIREKIFAANIKGMEDCEMIFAITDEKDMGTIWECGFVYGMRNEQRKVQGDKCKSGPIIVYYCETLGNGMFNLMLAQSGDIVITKFEDLDKLPGLITSGEGLAYAGIVE